MESNQNKQKDNIPKEKVDGLINFLGIDFSMSWNEMTSFVSKNLKQHKDHIRLNREKNLVEFYCKSFNGCETTIEKMLLAIMKKYLFVPEFRNFPEGVMTISTGGGFKFMEGYCGSGKNGDTLCIYPELLKPNMVGAMYLFKDQFGKEKLNF